MRLQGQPLSRQPSILERQVTPPPDYYQSQGFETRTVGEEWVKPELESWRNQCGLTQYQSRPSSESGEVIGLLGTGAKECGSYGRARRRAIQEAASDSHANEMKKSRRVTSRGNGGFIDAKLEAQ